MSAKNDMAPRPGPPGAAEGATAGPEEASVSQEEKQNKEQVRHNEKKNNHDKIVLFEQKIQSIANHSPSPLLALEGLRPLARPVSCARKLSLGMPAERLGDRLPLLAPKLGVSLFCGEKLKGKRRRV